MRVLKEEDNKKRKRERVLGGKRRTRHTLLCVRVGREEMKIWRKRREKEMRKKILLEIMCLEFMELGFL